MVRYSLHVYISYYLINNYWLGHIKIFFNVFHIFQARASTRVSTRLQINRKWRQSESSVGERMLHGTVLWWRGGGLITCCAASLANRSMVSGSDIWVSMVTKASFTFGISLGIESMALSSPSPIVRRSVSSLDSVFVSSTMYWPSSCNASGTWRKKEMILVTKKTNR